MEWRQSSWRRHYNQQRPHEGLAGGRVAEAGERPLEDWVQTFAPRTDESEPLPAERRPAWIALHQQRPSHERFWITSADGADIDGTRHHLAGNAKGEFAFMARLHLAGEDRAIVTSIAGTTRDVVEVPVALGRWLA